MKHFSKHVKRVRAHIVKFRHPRAMLALLVGLSTLPAAVAVFVAPLGATVAQRGVPNLQMGQEVQSDASRVRELRQAYWKAVDVYKRMRLEGAENLAPPELNDPASISYYLNREGAAALRGAAPEDAPVLSDAQLKFNALLEKDQDLINGYVTLGFCPLSLKVSHPKSGFYDICTSLLNERKNNSRPQVSSSVLERQSIRMIDGAPIQTLRDRLNALQDVLGGARTYKGITRPRPSAHVFTSDSSSSSSVR